MSMVCPTPRLINPAVRRIVTITPQPSLLTCELSGRIKRSCMFAKFWSWLTATVSFDAQAWMACVSFCYFCLSWRVCWICYQPFSILNDVPEAPDLERSAIHEAVLSQVRALCVQSTPIGFEDAVVRARLFWYAYTQEGIITGLRGNRFVLYEFLCILLECMVNGASQERRRSGSFSESAAFPKRRRCAFWTSHSSLNVKVVSLFYR